MSKSPETAVLAAQISRAIGGRPVAAALFTCFNLDPAFFEEEVLPSLFDAQFDHAPRLRQFQLEEVLRDAGPIAVMYDHGALQTDRGSSCQAITYRAVARRNHAFFHPKLVLVLIGDEQTGLPSSLVLGVMSANLSESGWFHNLECVYLSQLDAASPAGLWKDLHRVLETIANETDEPPLALSTIQQFVAQQTGDPAKSLPRLYWGDQPFSEFLDAHLASYPQSPKLEIISPYFDQSEDTGALVALCETVKSEDVRLYLPCKADGTAECVSEYYAEAAGLAEWSRLPRILTMTAKSDDAPSRRVHAKTYRFYWPKDDRELIAVGSVNLTSAAHSGRQNGNLEVALLFEQPSLGRPWLEPLERPPTEFASKRQLDAELETVRSRPALALRYDWQSGELASLWQGPSAAPRFDCVIGSPLVIPATPPAVATTARSWQPLQLGEAAEAVREALLSSSFASVTWADHDHAHLILVEELNTAARPSRLLTLTPEEILRYWSALSQQQRDAVLRARLDELLTLEPSGGAVTKAVEQAGSSVFDSFAGLFHAFGQLEAYLHEAMDKGLFRKVEYRLLGEKWDSLSSLLQGTRDADDPVVAYLTLLTARDLLQRLQRDQRYSDFLAERQPLVDNLEQKLHPLDQLRARLSIKPADEQRQFVDWFEGQFLAGASDA